MTPNRKDRRALLKAARGSGVSKEEVIKFIETTEPTVEGVRPLEEGQRVRLNVATIMSDVNYPNKVEEYRNFVEQNSDKIFTVEYDERHTDGHFVSLVEDTREVKWLWWVGELEIVE